MRRAEPLAGLGGILLLVSLFLPWYGVTPTRSRDLQPYGIRTSAAGRPSS